MGERTVYFIQKTVLIGPLWWGTLILELERVQPGEKIEILCEEN